MTSILTHGPDTLAVASAPPPDAVMFDDGSYLILYSVEDPDDGTTHYYAQHYTSDGETLGDPILTDGDYPWESTRGQVAIATADGGFALARLAHREDPLDPTDYEDGILLRFFSADGHGAPEILVEEGFKSFPTFNSGPSLTRLDSGRILVSWNEVGGSFEDNLPIVSMYATDGTPIGKVYIYLNSGSSADLATITALSGGGYALAWVEHDDFGVGQVYLRTFDADNHVVIAPLAIGGASETAAVLALQRLGDGFVLVRSDGGITTAQVYAADASPVGDAVALSGVYYPAIRVAELSDGGFVITWAPADAAGIGRDVMAQRFDSQGHAFGSAFLVNHYTAGFQELTDVTATADGGFTITWQGPGDAGFGTYHADFSATTDLSLDNLLFGTSGNDALNGRAGADIMAGGIGDDTYYVDNAGDQVQENANAGNDVTISTITYQLTANVENLILRGEGAIDGLGNELNNRIFGNDAGNHLYGGAGSDDLRGMGGNDFLNGNSGADLMLGGLGDDTYSVETVGDRAIEYAGEGTDTVRASVAFTLGANVENLTLVGSGDLIGRGNDLANVLTGNAGANVLVGLGGNDRISGGAGADRMYGGMGDDTFYVDDINDKVLEAGGEGNDRVYSSVTFWVYNQSIETVILTGTTAIDGNGNSLNNSLFGNAGANHLNGASGDDKLDGGLGNDSLTGGGGSDIFFFSLNTGQDVISDFRAPGNDRINLHAYTGMEVAISQSGADTLIDLGGGNTVTVLNASQADVSNHIIW